MVEESCAVLKKPISFETTFGTYTAHEVLGEGGAGLVYGGHDPDRVPIAIKVLTGERITGDKRKRFKNEIAFLLRTRHDNIVRVLDHGIHNSDGSSRPFYVMPRFSESLRSVVGASRAPETTLALYSQLLDGVEAAHLNGVVHRDLKPENVLFDAQRSLLAVADFGVADFTEELLVTLVETKANQRLANFQYAAPEQRARGGKVGVAADIYALGLILNELYTGVVPHGTQFKQIGSVASEFAFLDEIVALMLRQDPVERPQSVSALRKV